MKRELTLPDGDKFVLRVARDVLARLNTTCFGNPDGKALAGKFARWPTLTAMLEDKAFLAMFLGQAQVLFDTIPEKGGSTVERMTIEMPEPVGWDTTVPRGDIGDDELEKHALNMMVGGLIVKADSPRKAPITDLITLACHFSKDWHTWAIEIYSINPGFDIGWVSESNGEGGDITKKLDRVFIPFDHPGEELAAA